MFCKRCCETGQLGSMDAGLIMQDKKAERRKEKLAEWERRRLELQLEHQRGTEFPEFEFDEAEGDPEFIALVKEAIQRFDFEELPEIDQSVFRLMKQEGAAHALQTLYQAMAEVRKGHPDNPYAQVGDIFGPYLSGKLFSKRFP